MSRVTSPCSWLTALTAPADRSASAVMLNCGPPPLSCAPSARNRSRCGPSVPQQPARCFSTRWNGNASCPAGTGVCVVKIVVSADLVERVVERRPRSIRSRMRCSTTNAGVSFVEVEHAGVDAERLERAHAADAEDDLLLDARFAIAAVEARRQLAIPRRVLLEVGVEQVQRDAAERTRQTATSTERSPSGTAVIARLAVRQSSPARSARRPSSGVRSFLPASLRPRRADGSSPADT